MIAPIGPYLNGHFDTQDQLRSHLMEKAAAMVSGERAVKSSLDRTTFERRREEMRTHFLNALGGLPGQRGDLAVRWCGEPLQREGYTIERLIYESLPQVPVTANLYRPTGAEGPLPAVLFVCGHAREAKAYPPYQRVCRDLALAGMIVLAIDPLGQGERLSYADLEGDDRKASWGTQEHSYTGFQCTLTGSNIARYFIWDAVRGVDLLVSLPDVDANRVGVTGNSGGGTQTSLLLMVEPRIAAAVPCTYTNERLTYMATGQAHDAEQNYFGAIQAGFNYADMLAAIAPKPLQIGAVASDFFPVDGTMAAYEELRQIYEQYGAAKNLRLVISPGLHQYSATLRREAVAFFRRHLKDEPVDLGPSVAIAASSFESAFAPNIDLAPADEDLKPIEETEALQCTRSRQVIVEFGPAVRTVYHLNVEAWREWQAQHSGERTLDTVRRALMRRIREPRTAIPLWVRRFGVREAKDATYEHFYFFSEPRLAVAGIEIAATAENDGDAGCVVAHETGTLLLSEPGGLAALRAYTGTSLLVVDPRGRGSVAQRPVNGQPVLAYYGTEFKLNYDALMLGDSLFAMRCYDFDRSCELVARRGVALDGYGQGIAGLELLCVAAMRGDFRRLRLIDLPPSWEELATQRVFEIDFRREVFGVLQDFDVDDLLALVEASGTEVDLTRR